MPDRRQGLLFLLGAALLHLGFALGYARTILPAHDASQMDARWLADDGPIDVLVAGDSHARFGIEAAVLGSAVNVAVPGAHYGKTRFRVPWLIDQGTRPAPSVVILPYDAVSFSSFKAERYDPEVVWGRYVDFATLAHEENAPFTYFGKALKAYAVPYVGEVGTIIQYATKRRHFRDRPGGAASLGLPRASTPAQIAARHFATAEPFDARMVGALRALIAALRARGIRVVLVRFPVSPAYRAAAASLGVRDDERDRLLVALVAPGAVDHLDFTSAFDDRPRAFLDGDHLGPRGRRALTRRLGRALVELGAREARDGP